MKDKWFSPDVPTISTGPSCTAYTEGGNRRTCKRLGFVSRDGAQVPQIALVAN